MIACTDVYPIYDLHGIFVGKYCIANVYGMGLPMRIVVHLCCWFIFSLKIWISSIRDLTTTAMLTDKAQTTERVRDSAANFSCKTIKDSFSSIAHDFRWDELNMKTVENVEKVIAKNPSGVRSQLRNLEL